MLLLLTLTALAAEPSAKVLDSGAILGQVSLQVAPDALLQKLADPVWITVVDGEGTEVVVRSREGDCIVGEWTAPSALGPQAYVAKRCMLVDGVEATLVSSDNFSAYRTRWTVAAEGEGSLLTYEIAVISNLMVPQYFVNSSTRKAVLHLMGQMQKEFAPTAD